MAPRGYDPWQDAGAPRRAAAVPVPQQIPDLMCWWHTRWTGAKTNPTDITLNAGNVSLWVPRADNGAFNYNLQQATVLTQPPYDSTSSGFLNTEPSVGSVPAAGFVNFADLNVRNYFALSPTDWTLFFCVRMPVSAGSTRRLMLTNAFAAPTADGFELVRTNTNEMRAQIGNSSGVYYAQVTTATAGSFNAVDRWFSVRHVRNTSLEILFSGGSVLAGTLGALPATGGATNSFLGNEFRVPYACLYGRAITNGEIAQLAADVAVGGANDYGVAA